MDVNFQTIFLSFQVSGWQTLKRNAGLRGMPHVGPNFLTSIYINDKAKLLRSFFAYPLFELELVFVFSAAVSLKGESIYRGIWPRWRRSCTGEICNKLPDHHNGRLP